LLVFGERGTLSGMATDLKNGAPDSVWTLARSFRREGVAGWVAELPPELCGLADTNEEPCRSPLRLLEDGNDLGPAHVAHEAIRRSGAGAYSFWIKSLYFSTSDGSDPNTNDRSYTVVLSPQPAEAKELKPKLADNPAEWTAPERPLRCAILGLGNRGLSLGALAQSFAGVEVAWLVDRSEERVAEAIKLFGGDARGATDPTLPLADPAVDIAFVTVPDHLHRSVAVPAFQAGKHVFLEKPLATTAADAAAILAAWRQSGKILQLGYVLRQAPFYAAIREAVRQDMLGSVRVASLTEQLDVRHGASFMRRWHAHSSQSGGLIVHKGCHDLDIICWLLDARPRTVSSFGGVDTFVGPPPAQFCSQCDRRATCPYVDTALHERRTAAETANPTAYDLDRCVFRTDKDIVDNQVVSFVLDTGTRGTFYLAMQGPIRSERRITLVGDRARLDGIFEDGSFRVTFTDPERPPFVWSAEGRSRGGHGGGDRVTMLEFLNACVGRAPAPVTDAQEAIRGLIFALAAERARLEEVVVRLDESDFALSS
jgi:predicted dehydrogenase